MVMDEAAMTGPARFVAEVVDEAEGVVVSLAGELDLAGAETLREVFLLPEVLNSPAVRVDLAGVKFLDSTCIGVLVSACKRVRSKGGTFSASCVEGIVHRVLHVSGLLDFFDIEEGAGLGR
jgi:anti-anti-sigma factor